MFLTTLTPDCKPIAVKLRQYTSSDAKFIESETQRLLAEGIIEPSTSSWRAQVLVTADEKHKKRMVIDYSQTVNRFSQLDAYPLPRIDDIVQKIAQYSIYSTLDLKGAHHQVLLREEDKQYTAFESCGRLYQFARMLFGVVNGAAGFQLTLDDLIESKELRDTFAYYDNVTICGNTQEEHDANLNKFLDVAKKYNMTFSDDKSIISTTSFQILKKVIENSVVSSIDETISFEVETDASDYAIAATLNQAGRPVAFSSEHLILSFRTESFTC